MARLLALASAVALVAAPAGAAATHAKPTARDRADARALAAAGKRFDSAVAAAAQELGNQWADALSACDAWAALDAVEQDIALDALLYEIGPVASLRVSLPSFRGFAAALRRIAPRDPTLKAGHAVYARLARLTIARGELLPAVDVCAALTAWEETDYDPEFDLLPPAGIARAVFDAAFAARREPAAERKARVALYARLRACGISAKDAAFFKP